MDGHRASGATSALSEASQLRLDPQSVEAGRAGVSWTNAPQASTALPGMGVPEVLVPIVRPEVPSAENAPPARFHWS